ncbi:MAG: ATP-dependent DNA helicase RecG [Candidatus Parabeggiatoa sp. nov. 3]|nr:MAG: ATP-dependent DNA helicase RecG [Gammaproteobacteria bacterium]
MNEKTLLDTIASGESSRIQFKADFKNPNQLAAEMVALANSGGGRILVGVNDDGSITGLLAPDIGRLNQLISNVASQLVHPPINPITENMRFEQGLVIIIEIPAGISKPYMDNQGAIWVKSGADKRKVTAREEMQRLFQSEGLVYADEVPVPHSSIADIEPSVFRTYYENRYEESLEESGLPLPRLLENLHLFRNEQLTLTGLLLFGKAPQLLKPAFMIKAAVWPGNEIDIEHYIDSQDISGTLSAVFEQTLSFISRNLRRVQQGQSVNSLGKLEIPKIAIEEMIVNALLHRDYFISAPIKVFVFDNRIEIISPGHLPNNLTLANIRHGISSMRNPVLVSHAIHLLPYRGLGTGIRRAYKAWQAIDFIDDREGNQFQVIIDRQ